MSPLAIPFYQVDAFTEALFKGNPAAICLLENWLPDDILQKIAAENNLSETAFLVKWPDSKYDYHLRWFTPSAEVALCGHATLASAYCIFNHLNFSGDLIRFHSLSGTLTVTKETDGFTLDFPARTYEEIQNLSDLEALIGHKILTGLRSIKTCAVFENPKDVINFQPDFEKIKAIPKSDGLIITARTNDGVDFISRYFAPHVGINEDPVTGSAHCLLAPYWGKILNKTTLKAKQVSARGGELTLTLKDDRVLITGKAKLFLRGEIYV